MAKKKMAMVQPVPDKPESFINDFGGPDKLAKVLTQLGNDRAYTVLESFSNGWSVFFEGDFQPSMVVFKVDKWQIIQAKLTT